MNLDKSTVSGFGEEWQRFDQSELSAAERAQLFDRYFAMFPWSLLPLGAQGFDLGCGSGRWAAVVAPRVATLNCIDASEDALAVARRNLAAEGSCVFHHASVDAIPLADNSMDFGYSLGVLHHVPDTAAGIRSCVAKLKKGAPLLLYLYYAFDNRPQWFKALWTLSDVARKGISKLPERGRAAICDVAAATVYWPLARTSWLLEAIGRDVRTIPLSSYRTTSFYTMRTDARDRFGTRLEQRFTRAQMEQMMTEAGLRDVRFSEEVPFWCAVGIKA